MNVTYQIEYPYHIVEFINSGRKPRQKSVDIVATSWMTYNQKKKKVFVSYPPPPYDEESYALYNEHLKYRLDSLLTWKEYPIKVKGKATTLDEANEKLKILNAQDTALTLDSDNNAVETEKRALQKIKQSLLIEQAQKVKKSMATQLNPNNGNIPDASKGINAHQESNVEKAATSFKLKNGSNSFNVSSKNVKQQELLKSKGQYTVNSSYTQEDLFKMPIDFVDDNTIASSASSSALRASVSSLGSSMISSMNNVRSKEISSNSALESVLFNNFATVLTELKGIKADLKRIRQDMGVLKVTGIDKTENKSSIISVHQLKDFYSYDVPFTTLQNFEEFDQDLEKRPKLQADIKSIIEMAFDPTLPTSRFFVKILKLFLEKEVAIRFTAVQATATKQPIYFTNYFTLVLAALKEKNKDLNIFTSDKEIRSALSNTMSNVPGWYSNKKGTQKKDNLAEGNSTDIGDSAKTKSVHSKRPNAPGLINPDANSSNSSVEREDSLKDTEIEAEDEDGNEEDENNEFLQSFLGLE